MVFLLPQRPLLLALPGTEIPSPLFPPPNIVDFRDQLCGPPFYHPLTP